MRTYAITILIFLGFISIHAQQTIHVHWLFIHYEKADNSSPEPFYYPHTDAYLVFEDHKVQDFSAVKVASLVGGVWTIGEEPFKITKDQPMAFGNWYAGGGDNYEIRQDGNELVVYMQPVDEVPPEDETYEQPAFSEQFRIPIPENTEVIVNSTVRLPK